MATDKEVEDYKFLSSKIISISKKRNINPETFLSVILDVLRNFFREAYQLEDKEILSFISKFLDVREDL